MVAGGGLGHGQPEPDPPVPDASGSRGAGARDRAADQQPTPSLAEEVRILRTDPARVEADRPRGAGPGEARRAGLRVPLHLAAHAASRTNPARVRYFRRLWRVGSRRNSLQRPPPFFILCFHPETSMCARGLWTSPVVRRG
ncbi:MAG: hypothetical protein MZV64_70640 [Ignavibacteriales bacterium]|nr:hypothetical protein [Ignavibacteriales bacterium]